MKTSSISRHDSGFTLVELLVVITIIAVLAAMSFVGINGALTRAKSTESMVLATAVEQAVNDFYSEYNRLPKFTGEITTEGSEGVKFLNILLGKETTTPPENSRGIVFLTAKTAKGKRGGLAYGAGSGGTLEGLYDAFGNPFRVTLNSDYKDEFDVTVGSTTSTVRGEQVAVYSKGADEEWGTQDDVKTFN